MRVILGDARLVIRFTQTFPPLSFVAAAVAGARKECAWLTKGSAYQIIENAQKQISTAETI